MTNARAKRRAARVRVLLSALLLISLVGNFACAAGPDTAPGAVHVLTTDDDVGPVMFRYLDRGIDRAEDQEAAAVVIRLDTPGGLLSSTDDIIQRILESEVPVVVYVWPSGGQAASAGTYIAYASHVAAMAPGTVIGAATPISGSGDDLGDDLRNKLIGNSVAKIREYAELRDRNADWAERAVREGISASASEAVEMNIVDIQADDLDSLLDQMDGLEVAVPGGEVTLATADAQVAYNDMTFIENLLAVIANPNIAFLLLSLGSLAIFIEILHPGAIFPGVFGVVAIILAFFALSVLPFNWAAVALIFFAFVLFGLELFVTSGGVLGIGGVVSLIFGGLLLTSGSDPDAPTVSPWVIAIVSAPIAALMLTVFVSIMKVRRMGPRMGLATIVGRTVAARSLLSGSGRKPSEGVMAAMRCASRIGQNTRESVSE